MGFVKDKIFEYEYDYETARYIASREELEEALVLIISDLYFKNKNKEEIRNMVKDFIEDDDIFGGLIELYGNHLYYYFEKKLTADDVI